MSEPGVSPTAVVVAVVVVVLLLLLVFVLVGSHSQEPIPANEYG